MTDIFQEDNCLKNELLSSDCKLVVGQANRSSNPEISILMPIYNHPQFFEKALSSALSQDCEFDYEIIVCDNNHPDFQPLNQKIVEQFSDPRIKYYVNSSNIGGLNNWNRCIQLASSRDVTFCHDDDELLPSALRLLYNKREDVLNKYSLIIGGYDKIDEKDNLILSKRRFYINFSRIPLVAWVLQSNFTNGCGALYSREKLVAIGGFTSRFIPCPDYELNVRYAYLYGSYFLNEKTFLYRVSQYSDSSTAYVNMSKIDTSIKNLVVEKIPCFKSLLLFYIKKYEYINVFSQNKKWDLAFKSTFFERINVLFIKLYLFILMHLFLINGLLTQISDEDNFNL